MSKFKTILLTGAAFVALSALSAQAQIKIGINISATGPGAALGIPQKNGVALMPKTIAGQSVEYFVLDDATDPTKAVTNARKMISEDKIDALIGSSVTPSSVPLIDVAAEAKLPLIATVPTLKMIEPQDDKRKWVFKVVQNDAIMAEALADHMVKAGIKTIGFIGYNDAYGDGWYEQVEKVMPAKGIKIIAKESFARADTSVTGQALKLVSAKPDAILIVASGTPAVLPQKTLKERGYTGPIYQTHGISTMEFVRVGGKDVEGTVFPAGPVIVADQLADGNPIKKVGIDFNTRYKEMYGAPPAAFAAHTADAMNVLATAIPVALKTAKPGTPEFRAALRDALETTKEAALNHGVVSYSATDHAGMDKRSRVLIKIENGKWNLIP